MGSFEFAQTFCLLTLVLTPCYAQEEFSAYKEASRSYYSVGESGVLTHGEITLMGPNDGFDLIQLLEHELVRLDIDISPEQLSKVDQIQKKMFNDEVRGLRIREANRDYEAGSLTIRNDLEKFRKRFAQVLSEGQVQRLEQILMHQEFQQSAIAAKLQYMINKQEIAVSYESFFKFYQLSKREGGELALKCKRLQGESCKKLLNVLTKKQQLQISEFFELTDFSFDIPIDVFVWQCRNLEVDIREYDVPERFQKFAGVLSLPLFQVQLDGNVVLAMTGADSPEYRMSALMSSVFDLIREQSVGSGDDRWHAIHDECEKIREEYHDLGHRLVKRRTEMGDRWNDKHQEFYYQKLQGFCLESLDKVEALMTETQQAELVERMTKRRIIQFGLPASLLFGELSERLEVTDSQKRELKEVCERITQNYEQFADQAYEHHFGVMMEAFSEKETKAMDELIGKPLKGWKPAVGFWAHRLTRIGQ